MLNERQANLFSLLFPSLDSVSLLRAPLLLRSCPILHCSCSCSCSGTLCDRNGSIVLITNSSRTHCLHESIKTLKALDSRHVPACFFLFRSFLACGAPRAIYRQPLHTIRSLIPPDSSSSGLKFLETFEGTPRCFY